MSRALPQLKDGKQLAFFKCGGSWSYIRTPIGFSSSPSQGKPVPLLIRCRGFGGYVRKGEADWQEKPEQKIVVDAMIQCGYAVAGSDLTGDHWGRPASVAALVSLYNQLAEYGNLDASRVGMFTGAGMGGMALWNSVIGPLHGKIKAVALIQAIVSMSGMFPSRRTNIKNAYGIAENTDDVPALSSLAPNDPIIQTRIFLSGRDASFAKGFPKTLFLHGDKDEQVDYHENAVTMTNLLKEHGVDCTIETFYGRGHELHTMGNQVAKVMSNFFNASIS